MTNGPKNKVLRVSIFTFEKDEQLSAKGPIGKFFLKKPCKKL